MSDDPDLIDRVVAARMANKRSALEHGRQANATARDPVNSPSHYAEQGGVECIEAMRSMLSAEEYRGYLRGQMLKYTWRAPHKGAYRQDLEKAAWYHARLIEALEASE